MLFPWALLAGMSELFLAENRRGVLTRSVLGAVFVSCFVLPQIAGGLESAGPRLFDSEVNANTLMLGLESFTVEGWFGMGLTVEVKVNVGVGFGLVLVLEFGLGFELGLGWS